MIPNEIVTMLYKRGYRVTWSEDSYIVYADEKGREIVFEDAATVNDGWLMAYDHYNKQRRQKQRDGFLAYSVYLPSLYFILLALIHWNDQPDRALLDLLAAVLINTFILMKGIRP